MRLKGGAREFANDEGPENRAFVVDALMLNAYQIAIRFAPSRTIGSPGLH